MIISLLQVQITHVDWMGKPPLSPPYPCTVAPSINDPFWTPFSVSAVHFEIP